ncbi:MAG: carboxy-S-adenosyl-L-methionine synthase CmoA [Mariprofundaceae bacterium]|nr:carboxy-S-adenosyl-L-methionine synthase CmoA [Mariprofundaceae bacterium]
MVQQTSNTSRDTLFSQDGQNPHQPFAFDAEVSKVFEDMIRRSVPGYALTLQMIALIAGQYGQENSKLYDLGCSLGASTLALRQGLQAQGCVIVGVDNSEAMLQRCADNVVLLDGHTPVDLVLADIEHADIHDASVVVLNFTLQFIAKDKRQALLQRIYAGMRRGGVLIVSEKVMFDDENEQKQHIHLHEAFKKGQGYSDLEVSRKRQSLENVLIPESMAAHHARLKAAGFAPSHTWFQCFNFVSILAYKK